MIFEILILATLLALCIPRIAKAGTIVDGSSRVPVDSRQVHARYVRFRPGQGQEVTLNPPRFSWPYLKEIVFPGKQVAADQRYTLQISKTADFEELEVEVKDTECNFYNFLRPLEGADEWYWRVGYLVGSGKENWSDVHSFKFSQDVVEWDRSQSPGLLDKVATHPRILFNAKTRDEVLCSKTKHPFSADLAEHIISTADRTLTEPWFVNFPEVDDVMGTNYMQMGRSLMFPAFAELLTGNIKYLAFKERILTMASWPIGGYASPEGAGAVQKWPSHLTEYFGLIYDWFYDRLTHDERIVIRNSLEWRIKHTMDSFAWKAEQGTKMSTRSISALCASHSYENLMVTIPGMLAICDESGIAQEGLEVGLHYLMGITSAMGEDECWNEGPGYGNGKMKWLMDATWYLMTSIPELDLGKNPMYSEYCDFFARLTPTGAAHCSFGNRGFNEADWCSSRITTLRRVAMLRKDCTAMQNWKATRERLADLGYKESMPFSPWIDYVLPYYAEEPEPVAETSYSRVFPVEGWVTVSSAPPSDYQAQKDAVSMSFVCRPRGGYSHAFRSENGFDLHAYGETVTVGGDNTSNQSYFANHTMSHNTLLVNGIEQVAATEADAPVCGRIIAYQEGDDFVYWAGDATGGYGNASGLARFIRHVLFVGGEYFVIYDDLALQEGVDPGTFQWLYHITPEVPLEFDESAFRIRYAIGNAEMLVQHFANVPDLTFDDRVGVDGMTNPLTGENVTRSDKWITGNRPKKRVPPPIEAHHLWVSHTTPRTEMQFMTLLAPFKKGEAIPVAKRVSDRAVSISFRGAEKRVAFEQDESAEISVDVDAISAGRN